MPNLLTSLLRGSPEKRYTVSQYAQWLEQAGPFGYIGGQSVHSDTETIENSFLGYAAGAYKRNSIVFTAMLKRSALFSEARFQYQQMRGGRPGDLFGDASLSILERPWPNGTTGELLTRMIQDADLAGNAYLVREATRFRRLRPDWVTIVLTAAPAEAVASDVAGYLYHPGGVGSGTEPEIYPVGEVVHWSPIPDPEAQYRGMTWLSSIVREIQADSAATEHKLKFFENGATLQTVMTLGDSVTKDQFKEWVTKFKEAHRGHRNAYEPLFLGGGADAKVVGADLKQVDFKATQGAGETRIASVSGMGAVVLALSEGMQGSSLNAGNFAAARRLVADSVLRPLWRSACAALESVVNVPSGSRLWYDDRDIAFLREDTKDLADIQSTEAQSMRALVESGWEPESVKAAIVSQDWTLLVHTGTFSVQLQPPGDANSETPTEPEPSDDGDASDEEDET